MVTFGVDVESVHLSFEGSVRDLTKQHVRLSCIGIESSVCVFFVEPLQSNITGVKTHDRRVYPRNLPLCRSQCQYYPLST